MKRKIVALEFEKIMEQLMKYLNKNEIEKELRNLLRQSRYRVNPVSEEYEVTLEITIKKVRKRI